MPKSLSSLVYPADIYNEIIKFTDSSFLNLNLETEFIVNIIKLCLKLADICAKDNSPDNKVDNMADIT